MNQLRHVVCRDKNFITFLLQSVKSSSLDRLSIASYVHCRQRLFKLSVRHCSFLANIVSLDCKSLYHYRNMSSDSSSRTSHKAAVSQQQHPVNFEVLFYIPNIIGYGRIFLACTAFIFYREPPWFIVFYTSSIILDGFDGYAARKLNQCSKFGAWFDVIIDLFSRGYLWCALFNGGYLIVFLEWVTFLSTHSRGENWKIPDEKFPALVTAVMANGFKTPAGFFAVGSLHVLPLWFYCYESRFFTQTLGLPMWLQLSGIVALSIGRTVCAAVELFYCKEYVADLLRK